MTDPERLAREYVAHHSRARPRPMKPRAIYRFPRGRQMDRVPMSPVLLTNVVG